MHKNPLISIVLPIYNVEKYLRKSLDAILTQTYQNIEVICVLDGTPDTSPVIVQEYSDRDARIKIISQENRGLMLARATGFRAAVGEFVISIDPDDYVSADFLQKLLETAIIHDADISVCGFELVDESGSRLSVVVPIYQECISGEKALEGLLCDDYMQSGLYPVWNKLYRRELFESYVPSDIIKGFGEDQYTNLILFEKANKVAFCKDILYSYVQRNTSMLKTPSKKSIDEFFYVWELKYGYLERYGLLNKREKDALDRFFFSSFSFMFYCLATSPRELFWHFSKQFANSSFVNRKNFQSMSKNFVLAFWITLVRIWRRISA